MIEMVELDVHRVVLSVSVVQVLWECSSFSTCRDNFQEALWSLFCICLVATFLFC